SHPPFVAHDPKHVDPQADQPRRAALHNVPDLRFEYGVSRSIRPYFRLHRNESKGKGKERDNAMSGPVDALEIQWLNVAWVMTRDQVLSPMLQGTLWCVSLFSSHEAAAKYTTGQLLDIS
ncbi:hypothetical protein C8R45DRAFT_842241, partial [Mycena sanguinolenta]